MIPIEIWVYWYQKLVVYATGVRRQCSGVTRVGSGVSSTLFRSGSDTSLRMGYLAVYLTLILNLAELQFPGGNNNYNKTKQKQKKDGKQQGE